MDHPTQAEPEPTPKPPSTPETNPASPEAATDPAPQPISQRESTAMPAPEETPASVDAQPLQQDTQAEPAVHAQQPEQLPEPASVVQPEATSPANAEQATVPGPQIEPAPESQPEPASVEAEPATAPEQRLAPEAATEPGPQSDPALQPAFQAGPPSGPFAQFGAAPPPDFEFATIPLTKPRKPRKPTPPRDPLAVALGNGSLFGVGYGMLGKWLLAVGTALLTIVLVVLLLTTFPTLWLEIVVLVWWVAVIGHGWWLATKQPRPTIPGAARKQRLVALAVALPILLIVGFLRFDAARIEQDVADARRTGDCGKATHALDGRWLGHRIVNAPLAAEQDDTSHACDLLRQATTDLDAALDGNAARLRAGMANLRTVLADLPGHDKMVGNTLDRFLDRLPTDDACDTKEITDWLGRGHPDKTVLDRAVDIVPRIAPKALVECADDLMGANNWTLARERYQQLIDEYPDHDLAPRAKEGVTKATQAIELANVRQLLTSTAGGQPAYCATPAPYSGAVAYGTASPNRALFYGNSEYTDRLPPEWKATDAADAVIIVCAGASEMGTPVDTCPYESTLSPLGYTDVTFKKISIPVKVYEVRTARLIADLRVEIGGATCPAVLEYRTPGYVDLGPPSEVYVTPADPDVHAGFTTLINP